MCSSLALSSVLMLFIHESMLYYRGVSFCNKICVPLKPHLFFTLILRYATTSSEVWLLGIHRFWLLRNIWSFPRYTTTLRGGPTHSGRWTTQGNSMVFWNYLSHVKFGHFLLPYLPFTYLLWFQFCVFMVVHERIVCVCMFVFLVFLFFFPVCLHHFILDCFYWPVFFPNEN